MNDTPDAALIAQTLHSLQAAPLPDALYAGGMPFPSRKAAIDIIKDLHALLFPMAFGRTRAADSDSALLQRIYQDLTRQAQLAFEFSACCRCADAAARAAQLCSAFFAQLADIRRTLCTDIQAIYEGDPAARSQQEVLACYPGFYAISIYRIAHALHQLGLPFVPRIMTEYAHEKTGIDIHAGAVIGAHFCIDHGTGIVVGETTVIGEHVKLYQGVTLGAKSFALDDEGNPIKGVQRHPRIGSHVVIYANATILGGDTVIGDGCVIGGNAWITHSVPAGQTVYHE